MKKLKPGQSEKSKKVNRKSVQELKAKIAELEKLNDDSMYLKHLKGALKKF